MYRTITPQKAFEVRLRLFFENLLWIFVFIGSQALILVRGCVNMRNNYHFVISTERSDEKSLIQTLRFLPPVRNDMKR